MMIMAGFFKPMSSCIILYEHHMGEDAAALVGNTTLSALNLGNNLLSDSMKETMEQNPSVNLEVIV